MPLLRLNEKGAANVLCPVVAFFLGRGSRYLNQENCWCSGMGLRAGFAPSALPDGTTVQEKTGMNVLTVPVWH